MSRRFLTAVAFCLTTVVVWPAVAGAQMTLNIGGGIVAATFGGSDADAVAGPGVNKGSRIGINAGASLSIPVANRFAVVPGAFYAQKGAEFSDSGDKATFEFDYIEIPLLVSLMLTGEGSSVGFSIFAGPTFAFEIGCDVAVESGSISASESCDDAGADERQQFDIGVAGGAGISFPISERLSIMVSGGYDLGLRTLDTSADPDDLKNSAFFGTVGVGIPIG